MAIWMIMGVIAVAAAALLAVALFARHDFERLEKLDEHSRVFFRAASSLLEDEKLPQTCSAVLVFLSRELADPASTRRLKTALSRIAKMSSNDFKSRRAVSAAIYDQDYFLAKPGAKLIFAQAVSAGLLAISYRDPWRGPQVRARMAEILADPSRAGTFAACVQQSLQTEFSSLQAV